MPALRMHPLREADLGGVAIFICHFLGRCSLLIITLLLPGPHVHCFYLGWSLRLTLDFCSVLFPPKPCSTGTQSRPE